MRHFRNAGWLMMLTIVTGCVVATAPEPTVVPATVTTGETVSDGAVHAELQRLERSKWLPAAMADREAYMKLFADDFVSVEYGSDVHGGVHRRTRADVFSGPPPPASHFELSDWHYVQATPDVVVISYRVNGLSFPWQAYATSVWVHRDGGWKTVFHQASTAEDETTK